MLLVRFKKGVKKASVELKDAGINAVFYVSYLNIRWKNGSTNKLEALERPQLFFENGKLVALLCAVNENQGPSYNIQIPLKPQ